MLSQSKTYLSAIRSVAQKMSGKSGRVLVTGASGLIGSCMVDTLLLANKEFGHQWSVYATGRNAQKLFARFGPETEQLHFLEQDMNDFSASLPETDYIIHAASNADPIAYAKFPVETILTNLNGTQKLIRQCRLYPKTKLLFLSTFEVYGSVSGQNPLSEEDVGLINWNEIRSGYPESKRCAELMLRSAEKEWEVSFVIARLGSVYGPTMSREDSKAQAQFIRNGIKNEDIILKSKGQQRRSYIYVMDAVSALFMLMLKETCTGAYNVANDLSVASIAEVAEQIAEICGTQVVYNEPDEKEKSGYSKIIKDIVLDNHRLKAEGWKAEYSLRQGLEETINVLKESEQFA